MKRTLKALGLVVVVTAGLILAAGPAGAATTALLAKTSSIPYPSKVSGLYCQNKTITLDTLPTGYRYAWNEFFPNGDPLGPATSVTYYANTFHGTFYWSVCLSSTQGTKGISTAYYPYKEWSILTQVTSACSLQGHCTSYELDPHYVHDTETQNASWGSEVYRVTAGWCSLPGTCSDAWGVTVTKT